MGWFGRLGPLYIVVDCATAAELGWDAGGVVIRMGQMQCRELWHPIKEEAVVGIGTGRSTLL
jgi:hypothetical protein